MALLQPKQKKLKAQVRLNMDATVWEKAKAYCEWANFAKKEDFLEQAIEYVLNKDRDWKEYITQADKE